MTDNISFEHLDVQSMVLSGPIIRKLHQTEVNFWLVSQKDVSWRCLFFNEADLIEPYVVMETRSEKQQPLHDELDQCSFFKATLFQASPKCFILNLRGCHPKGFILDRPIYYDLQFRQPQSSHWVSIRQWGGEALTYAHMALPFFIIKSQNDKIFHGSCRKPHHPGYDGLARADRYCEAVVQEENFSNQFPNLLVMSGDQVYVDDVAGPMLVAIHHLIDRLELPEEVFENEFVSDSSCLHHHANLLYSRDKLLPDTTQATSAYDAIFGGAKKPIFTSVHAKNHLISLSEMIALYLLI